jgi:hypothetical protein
MAYSIIQKFKNSNVLEIETAEGVKQRQRETFETAQRETSETAEGVKLLKQRQRETAEGVKLLKNRFRLIVVYLNLFLYLCSRFTSKVWNKAD